LHSAAVLRLQQPSLPLHALRGVCQHLLKRPLSVFFSSRRRHTISKRDWSSDVCSSDLDSWATFQSALEAAKKVADRADATQKDRSEERRVGKECRTRWAPGQYRINMTDERRVETCTDCSRVRFSHILARRHQMYIEGRS